MSRKSVVKCCSMKVKLTNLPKNTVKLDITVAPEEIKISANKVWADVVKNAEIDGFRKGNAPIDVVKQKTDPRKIQNEIISEVINSSYRQAVEEQKILPIVSPKVELDSFDPEKEFTYTATTALRPTIKIGDYKKAIKETYEKKNTAQEKKEGEEHQHTHLTPNEIVEAVLSVTETEISDLLVEDEANKMLSRLVNQLQSLKMDLDAYLKSQNKTAEDVRAEYATIARNNLAGELALMEVAKLEKFEATDEELQQTIDALGDPKLKEQYSKDEYQKAYVKSIIVKNKTLWKLSAPEDHQEPEEKGNTKDKKEEPDEKN